MRQQSGGGRWAQVTEVRSEEEKEESDLDGACGAVAGRRRVKSAGKTEERAVAVIKSESDEGMNECFGGGVTG